MLSSTARISSTYVLSENQSKMQLKLIGLKKILITESLLSQKKLFTV